jgi:microcystin-dependent protein
MGQPYVGEIRMFGGTFAPAGWMFCDGQLLPISENEPLFALIGTTYGGDGSPPSLCPIFAVACPCTRAPARPAAFRSASSAASRPSP